MEVAFDTLRDLQQTSTSAEQAAAFYDDLEPVALEFMLGRWRGEGFHTGHALDGVLERFGWYGKEFVDAETVHPLLFNGPAGGILKLNPGLMPLGLGLRVPALRGALSGALFRFACPLMATRRSRARLRMLEYRGKTSAAMVYDQLPIIDVFRKVDDGTALGVMDLKGMREPHFFVLRRENG